MLMRLSSIYEPLRAAIPLVLTVLLAACSPIQALSPDPSAPRMACDPEVVTRLEETLPGDDPPEHLIQENARRTREEFDVNQLLEVLTHLELEQGKVLDWVYRFDGFGGDPLIYVRSVDEAPFATYEELQQARGDIDPKAYVDVVRTDETPEGYVEYVLLYLLGDQFYLWWHSASRDLRVLCDREALRSAVEAADNFCMEMPEEVIRQALAVEPRAQVELGEERVIVRLHVFSKWGGLYRATYQVGSEPTPGVLSQQSENLVEYYCPVVF